VSWRDKPVSEWSKDELRVVHHELVAELESLKSRTRQLDVNDDAMVLFLESAKNSGFTIQLIPPTPLSPQLAAIINNLEHVFRALGVEKVTPKSVLNPELTAMVNKQVAAAMGTEDT